MFFPDTSQERLQQNTWAARKGGILITEDELKAQRTELFDGLRKGGGICKQSGNQLNSQIASFKVDSMSHQNRNTKQQAYIIDYISYFSIVEHYYFVYISD